MNQVPMSPYTKTCGMVYFPRMLDKIRKFAIGELREDFHDYLGKGLDGRCCDYLKVEYAAVKEQALSSASDEDIMQWCQEQGRTLSENDLLIWNAFLTKIGWKDHVTESLIQRKADAGLEDREDIQTMLEFMEVDEGRKA